MVSLKENNSKTAISGKTTFDDSKTTRLAVTKTTAAIEKVSTTEATLPYVSRTTNHNTILPIITPDKTMFSDVTTYRMPVTKTTETTEKIMPTKQTLVYEPATTNSWNTSVDIKTESAPTSESPPNDESGRSSYAYSKYGILTRYFYTDFKLQLFH